MFSRLYGRVWVVVGVTFAFLWFSSGFFQGHQYLPTYLHPSGYEVEEPHEYYKYKGPTPRHLYKKNGLLEVNPEAPHPIYELMQRGEDLWRAKLARSSKTLEQAVREYKKRYIRAPPPGFDKWWDYTEKHNVQLRDEYDQIWLSIEPFWGLSPAKLEKLRFAEEENNVLDLFHISKVQGQNITASRTKDNFVWAVRNQMALLEDIQDLLPPFNITYSPHDSPNYIADHEWRKKTAFASALKRPLPDDEVIQRGDLRGWKSACSPNTPYRPLNPFAPQSLDSPKKTFIFDHKIVRDPCSQPAPSYFPIAGLYALHKAPGPDPRLEIPPVFATCGTALHADIIAPTLYLWEEDVGPWDPPFNQKTDDHLFWRGSNTGSSFTKSNQHLLTMSHRTRLVRLASQHPPPENSTVYVLSPAGSRRDPVGAGVPHQLAEVNRAMMNISFARNPLQCDPEMCDKLAEMFEFGPFLNEWESSQHKYVIDVDGNGWSGRFKQMMTNHALIFKSTIYLEWLTDRIAPWVHYVPIQLDYSDLYDALFFFRGDEEGNGGHPDMAEKIAEAGREWSLKFWRKEDMTAYIFRLYLEYARVTSPDRITQKFEI